MVGSNPYQQTFRKYIEFNPEEILEGGCPIIITGAYMDEEKVKTIFNLINSYEGKRNVRIILPDSDPVMVKRIVVAEKTLQKAGKDYVLLNTKSGEYKEFIDYLKEHKI